MNIIVFGATGGVGSAVVRDLKKRGHTVLIAGRNAEKVEALSRETDSPGVVFIADSASIGEVFAKAKAEFESVDGVVSCVGTLAMQTLDKMDEAAVLKDVSEQVQIALSILFHTKRTVSTGGGIVFLSSVVTHRGAPAHVGIGGAKGAIEAMARCAAAEFARQGVRVNSLALGLTKTDATKHIWDKEGAAERLGKAYPLGLNEPESVAKAVAFLLETPGITGQTLVMDGGFSAI